MTQRTVRLRLSVLPVDLTSNYSGFPNGGFDLTHEMPWDRDLPAVGDFVSVGLQPWHRSAYSPLQIKGRVWELDGTPTLVLQGLVLYEDPERLEASTPTGGADIPNHAMRIRKGKGDAHPMEDLLAAGWVISSGDTQRVIR